MSKRSLNKMKIHFSRKDELRGLKLPTSMTEDLAEDIGIMVGDGHIGAHSHKGCTNYEICVSGDAISDRTYLKSYVWHLKKRLYNLKFPIFFAGKKKTEVRLQIYSRGLVEFYAKKIGLPLGKKENIRVPPVIRQGSLNVKRAFLRGLADTDFSLTFKKRVTKAYYPVIFYQTSCRSLYTTTRTLLNKLGFTVTGNYRKNRRFEIVHDAYYLQISGRKQLDKWMKEVGFSSFNNCLDTKCGES